MSKTVELMKKVSLVLTSGITISTLTSCGSVQPTYESSNQIEEEVIEDTSSYDDSTSSYDDSNVISEEEYEEEYEYTSTEPPYDENCSDWELDEEDGVWICNDQSSSFYKNFFFMGSYFATKNMLHNNNQFKQYKSSGIVSGSTTTKSGSGTGGTTSTKSGFGSGVSGGYGG